MSGRHIYAGGEALTVSRRDLLKGGVAAVTGTAAAALFGQTAAAQAPAGAQTGPGAATSARGGPIFWGNGNAGNRSRVESC